MDHRRGFVGSKPVSGWSRACGLTFGFAQTLMDAYFGFLTFFGWVAYKEQGWIARGSWFVAIMLLGNFAMSGYLLWQLSRIDDFTWEGLVASPFPRCLTFTY